MNTKNAEAMKFAAIVGGNLKYCRTKKTRFMPQKIPAAHIGVTYQQINKYESGLNLVDSYRLKQLADFFKVKTDDLVDPSFIHRDTLNNEVLSSAIKIAEEKLEETNGNI
jgi:ribosome-binding protein aMBF1 (putative translation factor)